MVMRRARAAGAAVLAGSIGALAGAIVLHLANGPRLGSTSLVTWILPGVAALSFSAAGALIAAHRPRNPIGWLFLALGASASLSYATGEYAIYGLLTAPRPVPGTIAAAWVYGWAWVLPLGLLAFILLLFPEGRLLSHRWRPVAFAAAVTVATALTATAVQPHLFEDQGVGIRVANPLAVDVLVPLVDPVVALCLVTLGALSITAAGALFVRYRRAGGDARDQLRWVAVAGVVAGASLLLPYELLHVATLPLVPLAAMAAVLRYRLYDVAPAVTRTGAYTILAGLTTLLYFAMLIGVGAATGARQPDIAVAVAATATAAVLFQPARAHIEAFIRRLLLGPRATPYAALAAFSRSVGSGVSTDELPQRMAAAIAAGVGAARVTVTVPLPDGTEHTNTWPSTFAADTVPDACDDHGSRTVDVRHEGQIVGRITVAMTAGDAITATEQMLLEDLAAASGPALHSVALTAALRHSLAQTEASRRRIVAAQDHERRRIERDLHDGVQQHLHALSASLGVAVQHAGDETAVVDRIHRAVDHAELAQTTLRNLVRGICPPILRDRGLTAAVRAAGDATEVPFTLEVSGGHNRWLPDVEMAAYLCCHEALQNATKHAFATRVAITFHDTTEALTFTVTDDGRGFEPAARHVGSGLRNLSDRLAALGGRLEIRSTPAAGTTLIGRIPLTPTTPSHPVPRGTTAPPAPADADGARERDRASPAPR